MAEDRTQETQAVDAGGAGDDLSSVFDDIAAERSDRREFLIKTVRRAAYIAPVVLLFKPREALAGSGGSAITPGP